METILNVLGAYLLLGLLALGLLELFTGRLRRKFRIASNETREKLMYSGTFVGKSTAIILTGLALWIFWPVAIYGAIRG